MAQGNDQQVWQRRSIAVVACVILLRFSSEEVQEFARINLGLSQQTSKRSDLDRLVERNDASPAAAPHHHMAPTLANSLKAHALQRSDDLPSGKVREFRHGQER
jgi:uncharacterized membrane protein YcjF (UPF0283 family)